MKTMVTRAALAADLAFDEDTHTYRWRGTVVPSVTQVMKPITKLWVSGELLEFTRQQGKAIDLMIEYDVAGNLDEETLPDWLKPILVSWRQFVDETGFTLIDTKPLLYHPMFKFAGEADLIGTLPKIKQRNKVKEPEIAVIDIKRNIPKTAAVQTAAYSELWNCQSTERQVRRRFALSLNPYRLVEYTDKSDWDVFLSCLSIHRWMERNR